MLEGYHKSTLRKLHGKANFYVVVTKLSALAKRPKEVERRSTGTSDRKLAKNLQHKITQDIYSEWDRLLQRDPFINLIEQHWDEIRLGCSIAEARMSGPSIVSGEKAYLVRQLLG